MNVQSASASFDDPLYARVAQIIHREAGIVLGPEKTSMMRARLTKRIAQTKTGDLATYMRLVEGPGAAQELPNLVSALTTNVTHFFRESHHFDFLRDTVVTEWLRGRRDQLKIWSAGCSSGQEPYSIAMSLSSPRLPAANVPDLSILATDIDLNILDRAKKAEYSEAEFATVPRDLAGPCFENVPGGHRVKPALRSKVEFRQLNLHAKWDLSTRFDVVFCRNVIIYFDPVAQERLWLKFMQQLRPGGWLIIGHSERVPEAMRDRLRPVGQTIYQLHPA